MPVHSAAVLEPISLLQRLLPALIGDLFDGEPVDVPLVFGSLCLPLQLIDGVVEFVSVSDQRLLLSHRQPGGIRVAYCLRDVLDVDLFERLLQRHLANGIEVISK